MAKLRRDKYLVHDEVRRLLYAARTRPHVRAKRDFTLFAIGTGTGARQSEILDIHVRDFMLDVEPPFVRITRRKKRKHKGLIDDVAMPATTRRAVLEYLRSLPPERREPDQRLFPITPQQAERLFKRYCSIAGLSPLYTFHAMRHYRGLALYEATGDLELVREALGHTNLSSTQIYVHTLDHARRAGAVDVGFIFADG